MLKILTILKNPEDPEGEKLFPDCSEDPGEKKPADDPDEEKPLPKDELAVNHESVKD